MMRRERREERGESARGVEEKEGEGGSRGEREGWRGSLTFGQFPSVPHLLSPTPFVRCTHSQKERREERGKRKEREILREEGSAGRERVFK